MRDVQPLLLRGGLALEPGSWDPQPRDVLFKEGHAVRVGAELEVDESQVEVIDVSGCWVVPGIVDLRVHLRDPGAEDVERLETTLATAAKAGVTAVCTLPGTRPVNDSAGATLALLSRAARFGGPELWPVGAMTLSLSGQSLAEMRELAEAGCVAVSDDTDEGPPPCSDALLRRAFEYATTFNLPVLRSGASGALGRGAQMHEGVVSTRLGLRGSPSAAEEISVGRDLRLAELTGTHLHVSQVSCAGAVAQIAAAKARGVAVSADVSPLHLTLTDEALLRFDPCAKVFPPLRSADDRAALRRGLEDGTLDAVASGHAPSDIAAKDCELELASFGVAGLPTLLPLLCALVHDGQLSMRRMVESLTSGPAQIVGRSRTLLQGAEALTVIDPELCWRIEASSGAATAFPGRLLRGGARLTWARGQLVHRLDSSQDNRAHHAPRSSL